MLTCRHVTRLLSESGDRPLTFSERWGLRLHLFLCSGCHRCEEQLGVLRVACQRLGAGEEQEGKNHPTP